MKILFEEYGDVLVESIVFLGFVLVIDAVVLPLVTGSGGWLAETLLELGVNAA